MIDPSIVAGAAQVQINKVVLYFKTKPLSSGNKSGILNPGVNVYLIPTVNSIPQISNLTTAPFARAEYGAVSVSLDASLPTVFTYSNLVTANTGTKYAVAIAYDGNEDFVLWKDETGDVILGTNTVSSGPSGSFVGDYYTYISPVPSTNANATANSGIVSTGSTNGGSVVANATYTSAAWTPSTGVSLKIAVSCARFSINGNSDLTDYLTSINPNAIPGAYITTPYGNYTQNTASGVATYTETTKAYEFIVYNRRYSSFDDVRIGERIWQWRPYIGTMTPLTAVLVANSNMVVATNFSWSSYFNVGTYSDTIVFVSENHDGPGLHRTIARKVTNIINGTTLVMDENAIWTNNTVYFYKTAIGTTQQITPTNAFGSREDLVILSGSTSNAQYRFSNNGVESLAITNGGNSYSNSDYVVITGYEYVANAVIGGSNCYANILTTSTGAISNIRVTQTGSGFVNTAAMNIQFFAANGATSNGSGAVLVPYIDCTLISEFDWNGQKGYFKGCRLVNLEISTILAGQFVVNPLGTYYNMSQRLSFYVVPQANTFSGEAYYKDSSDSQNDVFNIKAGFTIIPQFTKQRVDMSWSNEVLIDTILVGSHNSNIVSNCSIVSINAASNNDFVAATVGDGTICFSKYLINNDYTGENTNYGNASSKGLTEIITLANNQFAEDLVVFMDVYRPAGTDIKLFAKIYNSNDADSFAQKDWTLLNVVSGNTLFSSQTDPTNTIEMQYGFPNCPNTALRLAGSGTATLGNNVIVGQGTTWSSNSTANIQPGQLVKISQPLFPNNFMISLVTAVTDTSIVIDQSVSNNGMVGSGLFIDQIAYPKQAFVYGLDHGIVRYYGTNGAYYDTYNTIQLKTVLLAQNEQIVPYVDDIRSSFVSS